MAALARVAAAAILGLAAGSSMSSAVMYMTREEAVRWALPGAEVVIPETHALDKQTKRAVERATGWKTREDKVVFYKGMSGGEILGYAFIDDQIGKHQPITFVISLAPGGRVRDVEVMVYRETIGGQIKGRKFLNQFRDKDSSSPLRVGKDIDTITGATLSARSAARAVKKALVLFNSFYTASGSE